MSSAIKIRELVAAKANAKAGAGEAKGSTPLWKLKLQSRTNATPTTTPIRDKSKPAEEADSDRTLPGSTHNADLSAGGETQKLEQKEPFPELKLTIIQPPPLMPKPELTRPEPPSDRAALLRKLQDLRAAGSDMVEATAATAATSATSGAVAGALPAAPGCVGAGAAPAGRQPSSPLHQGQRLGFSSPAPQRYPATPGGLFPTTPAPIGAGGAGLATLAVTPGAAAAAPAATPGPSCLSTPSMLGLRQQEQKDTGGGFLTHYADPWVITTPSGTHGAGGPGGAARRAGVAGGPGAGGPGGGSTPLSVLRTMHRVQQLQRLRREGVQLVEAMEGRS